nr:Chain h, NADH dehydrogenase [ubiquinone] 1 alpha subcomplex subunit [Thermochaetoides thermophila DSM 1495]7ZMB_h Chain h, NADH dehydrogenase [ubiquinone] 1 alpha subcomplex subunit [Thermochaetoides thermophila DSM 1495]7ZMG_h Chain h, NADH dehydrogenase [ubiquinone] 1 alpha subcomplex subunit [Thermochaetoides thermophila DSM 1495]
MSYPTRTLANLRKIGLKEYFRQLLYIGDTKYGELVGVDKFGNKFYENKEELPLRTRWVDYAKHDYDAAHIEPMWHAWISYQVDTPPTREPLTQIERPWAPKEHVPNRSFTRGAYKPYNTTQPKIQSWEPKAAPR